MLGFSTTEHASINEIYHHATAPTLYTKSVNGSLFLDVQSGDSATVNSYEIGGDTLLWDGATNVTQSFKTFYATGRRFDLEQDHYERLKNNVSDFGHGECFISGLSGAAQDHASLMAVTAGAEVYFVAGLSARAGLYTLKQNTGGTLQQVAYTSDTSSTYLASPSALASAKIGARTFVFAASPTEAGVSSYEIHNDGSLIGIDNLGAENGIGINQPSVLLTTQVGAETVLLLGAAGSSSISAMSVDGNGNLTHINTIIDDQTTRFGGVHVMKSITISERVYVVAAGNDDGVSLFLLLPGGQLHHVQSLADTTALGLENINGMILQNLNGALQVYISSESEAGLTHLTVDIDPGGLTRFGTSGGGTIVTGAGADHLYGGSGNDRLEAGAGDDLLLDGHGQDVLLGGVGADVFIFSQDNTLDSILDFDLSQDKIDLSSWARLYSVGQLTIASETDGAMITFGQEQLRIFTANHKSLDYADFISTDVFGLFRPALPPTTTPITWVGTAEDDTKSGGDGDDNLTGGGGSDTIYGKGGRDNIQGGGGHDDLNGGGGDDILRGGTGKDHLNGGAGDDTLLGESSTDTLNGGEGNDVLRGGTGVDLLYGGVGADRLFGNTGVDELHGGAGDDYISGGDGVDQIWGDDGDDTIYGRSGWDVIYAGNGNDRIYASEGVDHVYGGGGNDWISGGSGWDVLAGDAGDDTLYGNFGADVLDGGAGRDNLIGGSGDDTLRGGAGNDTLFGNQGLDQIDGGTGDDVLRGGTLRDEFIFRVGDDADIISDFELNQDILKFATGLTGGLTDGSQIVSQFASLHGADVVFTFGGGDQITLESISSLSSIGDSILVF